MIAHSELIRMPDNAIAEWGRGKREAFETFLRIKLIWKHTCTQTKALIRATRHTAMM